MDWADTALEEGEWRLFFWQRWFWRVIDEPRFREFRAKIGIPLPETLLARAQA
jgi:hypothetical protein